MPIFPINGVHYHAEIWGNGPPLMLLHGFSGSAANWTQIASAFQDRWQVIAVDLLGHGQTSVPDDPARYRMENAAADLASLIGSLKIGPTHLLGYSMGGRLALFTVLHYPHMIRTLILESASPGLANEAERQVRRISDEALADRIEHDGIPDFVDYWESLSLFATQQYLPPATRSALHAQRLKNNPRGLANSLRGMGTGVQPSLWESLGQITVPTLLLAGALDDKFMAIAQQMVARIPGSAIAVIPDAGHTIHLEQPDAMIKHIAVWLNKMAASGRSESPRDLAP